MNAPATRGAWRDGPLPAALAVLTALYFLSSLGHFGHNAEFICEYPNLPASVTRLRVYLVWAGITAVGVLGVVLLLRRRRPGWRCWACMRRWASTDWAITPWPRWRCIPRRPTPPS